MKFKDFTAEQQQVLTAWMNGETMQYHEYSNNKWKDIDNMTVLQLAFEYEWDLRVKPKEPVVTYLYTGVDRFGCTEFGFEADDIEDINDYYELTEFVGYLKKTFSDGKFVKIEFIEQCSKGF